MKAAMLQPNYIPWKGVFDMIGRVDVFVFYDDVQYTARDWRNRNKIKTKDGDIWLTVPVFHTQGQLIKDIKIDSKSGWQKKHYRSIELSYAKARYFEKYKYILDEIYKNQIWENLSELNIFSTKLIAEALGLFPVWKNASELNITGDKSGEKIIKICKTLGCNYMLNGPSSRSFMDESLFQKSDIKLEYMDYDYKEYKQLFEPFSHNVTVLDVLFNCGEESSKYIWKRV